MSCVRLIVLKNHGLPAHDGDRDADIRAFAGSAVDRQVAVQLGDPFGDALEAEVSLRDAGSEVGIESATVVSDRENEISLVKRAGDL